MRRLRMALVVLTVVAPTVTASAATVGLTGGSSDPQPITDSARIVHSAVVGADCGA